MEYMFMPLKRYAEFSGRSRRMEYWMFTLFLIVMWIVLFGLFMVMAGSALLSAAGGSPTGVFAAGGTAMILGLLILVVWLALLIPSLAVGVRRLHDTDRSGWWLGGYIILAVVSNVLRTTTGSAGLGMVLSIATLIYAIALLVFMCLDGTRGPNKYGADPKGGVDAAVFA
ncbi:MAG: hypothetical protein JWO81_2402 [Alphaproteobacteria bacterium]|nr:hypothetical protein [Alphaproteobacteria bacterium]